MSGFADGQEFADDVADAARKEGAQELEPFVERLLRELELHNDFDAMRTAALRVYVREAPPQRLAELAEDVIVMAHLGGRLSVHEDAT